MRGGSGREGLRRTRGRRSKGEKWRLEGKTEGEG